MMDPVFSSTDSLEDDIPEDFALPLDALNLSEGNEDLFFILTSCYPVLVNYLNKIIQIIYSE